MSDPAETETEERKKAFFASIFDRIATSHLQLVKTVRVALLVVTACTVVQMSLQAFSTYSIRSELREIHVTMQAVRDAATKGSP